MAGKSFGKERAGSHLRSDKNTTAHLRDRGPSRKCAYYGARGAQPRVVRKEAWGGGISAAAGPTSTYQHAFDGELLQAPVPRRVKDHRQGLVRGLDVADLYLVLCRARGRRADGRAVRVVTPSARRRAWTHSLSPCGQGQIPVQCSTPEKGL